MSVTELTEKMKDGGITSLKDEDIDSVDFAMGSASENLKTLMDNPAMSGVKSVNVLVNRTFSSFIKECRDICKKENTK